MLQHYGHSISFPCFTGQQSIKPRKKNSTLHNIDHPQRIFLFDITILFIMLKKLSIHELIEVEDE